LVPYYYLAFVVGIVALILVNKLTYSAIGLRWSGVRENPDAAESVGINTHRAKVFVYLVGAGLAGTVGAVFAPFQGIVDPSTAHLDNTVIILTMVILGGGSNYGLLASAAVLTVVPELLRSLTTFRLLALGMFFVFIMNMRPGGFRFSVLKHFILPEWEKKPGEDEARSVADPEIVFNPLLVTPSELDEAGVQREAVLRGEDVTKRFGGLVAVNDVTFELNRGEVLGVIGPNGAGKTTLFNMITGAYPPFAGDIYLRDHKITGWDPHKIARRGVARTFQIIKLLPNLTVLDNTMLACLQENPSWNGQPPTAGGITQRPEEEAIELARAAISYVGLAGQEDTIARNLSFGNRRRLELARALATQPNIILMDEPASGMNPQEVNEVIDLIRGINARGISILLIEHNMTVAMKLSDRLIVLDHGEQIAEGTPDEIQHNEQVIDAYLGREQEVVAN
jgi:branched-chain amino acid transport system permease protein